jgi:hypothetical protein
MLAHQRTLLLAPNGGGALAGEAVECGYTTRAVVAVRSDRAAHNREPREDHAAQKIRRDH